MIMYLIPFVDSNDEEFYETQMVWKTQIKKRFESLRLQGTASYLHRHNNQNDADACQQNADEFR